MHAGAVAPESGELAQVGDQASAVDRGHVATPRLAASPRRLSTKCLIVASTHCSVLRMPPNHPSLWQPGGFE